MSISSIFNFIQDSKYKFANIIAESRQEISEINPQRVTQGKTHLSNRGVSFPAENAVDKILSTIAETHTENGAGWLKLEFDGVKLIHKVVIYYRFYTNWYDSENWCALSESNFKACVDKNNNVDVSVYQGEVRQKSCGTFSPTYALEQSDQIYTLLCDAKGDIVQLSKSTGRIVVCEIVVSSRGINISGPNTIIFIIADNK